MKQDLNDFFEVIMLMKKGEKKMPLKPCRECGKEISTQAKHCPHCGAPYPAKKSWKGPGFEWKSQTMIYGFPLVHIAFGRNEHGKFRVAKGIIAIGQFAIGLIAIAQFGIGILFGFGQFILGVTAIAQVAITAYFAIGQFAVGYIAIGQLALGYYVLAQVGYAKYVWSIDRKDVEAILFFKQLVEKINIF